MRLVDKLKAMHAELVSIHKELGLAPPPPAPGMVPSETPEMREQVDRSALVQYERRKEREKRQAELEAKKVRRAAMMCGRTR